ncbi:MAG: TonB-dependent receptor [Psychroserpens sp.]|uniref:TonB-dependent receptor domain-containing protein n=1 Tax=Psychroserpens sp. TaxID=2020870 RepID=UPI003CB2BD9B
MTLRITILFLVCINPVFAQTVTGRVTNSEGEPVPSAIISILDAETRAFIKGGLSNDEGDFSLRGITNGKYQLLITSLGLSDYVSEVFNMANNTVSLGQIEMIERTAALEEVTVVAEKPLIQVLPDKTIFNVAKTVNAIGDSGFELLRKAPGIMIDNADNIVVEGKAGVLVYIDDRPSVLRGQDLVNYLKTLQASDIEAIEIITQPSSRYDAEGNAGIINILLKRDKTLGTNGSIASSLTIGDFARTSNSVTFNNRKKKISLYGTYSNNFGKSTSFINLDRTQNGTNFDAQTESVYDFNSNNLRLGMDYYRNSKSTFGIILNGNFNNTFGNTDTRTPITPQNAINPTQILVSESNSKTKTSNIYTNLNYRYKDTLGHVLNIDIDYGNYYSDRQNLQPNRYFNATETEIISENSIFFDTPISILIYSGQIDYEQNLFNGTLGAGAKFSQVNTDNSFDPFDRTNGNNALDETQSNNFKYDEKITAAYLNYKSAFGKFNIQMGLRVENTNSDGQLTSLQDNTNDRVKRNYTNWFPSGGITYQPNRKNSVALVYSKRIQRPNYQSLNPFQYRIDELSFRQGNPFLQPQYTDNIKLSHTYNYKLTTSISYSYIEDFSAQVTEAVGNDQNFITQRNVANNKIINLGLSYPTKFNDWWSVYLSVNAFRSIYEATNADFISTEQNTLSLYAQNTFKLPKGLKAELSGWYSSPTVWGGTYETKSLGALNIAFQKTFLKDKLTARLGFNDILFTSPWQGTTRFGDLFIDANGGSDSRQIRFNLTYNFGGSDVKKVRQRDTGIENEQKRIE